MAAVEKQEFNSQSFAKRLIAYLAERFPLNKFGIMVSMFALSGLCFSQMLRGVQPLPPLPVFLITAVVTLLVFFQLRVADEFKDYEDDCLYQAYRPVPRGLVKLKELGVLAFLSALVQVVLVGFLGVKLFLPLAAVWLYMALMTKEFFVRDWLRAHTLIYVATHMFIMVFIDLFITACDWLRQGSSMPHGIYAFLCVSLCNGLIIEFGRKIRAPEQEENGVQTYSHMWGTGIASGVWLGFIVLAFIFATFTASLVKFSLPTASILTLFMLFATKVVFDFCKRPNKALADKIEFLSGFWVVLSYVCLGVLPAVLMSFYSGR